MICDDTHHACFTVRETSQPVSRRFSRRRSWFTPRAVHSRYVVEKVTVKQVYLRILRFSNVSIISPLISNHPWINGPVTQTQSLSNKRKMHSNASNRSNRLSSAGARCLPCISFPSNQYNSLINRPSNVTNTEVGQRPSEIFLKLNFKHLYNTFLPLN